MGMADKRRDELGAWNVKSCQKILKAQFDFEFVIKKIGVGQMFGEEDTILQNGTYSTSVKCLT